MENISIIRIENVSRRWKISKEDAYELIVTVESQQSDRVRVQPLVINPFFNGLAEDSIVEFKRPIIKKKNKFRSFFCCL